MNDGDGVYRIVNPAEKKVFLSYTLGSGISDLMTDADYLDKMVKHGIKLAHGCRCRWLFTEPRKRIQPVCPEGRRQQCGRTIRFYNRYL